jgi:hypothetical protein
VEKHAVASGIVQVGQDISQQFGPEDVRLAYWDLWMGIVSETNHLKPRTSWDTEGGRDIEALQGHGWSPL